MGGDTTTRLSLLISRPESPPPQTPPHTAVSVPFMWEEAPGKPRRCHSTQSDGDTTTKTLELPPRLLFLDGPSPTTVLGGPFVGRAVSFSSSYRTPKDYWAPTFGSARFGKVSREDEEGIFDFSGRSGYGRSPKSKAKRRSSLSLSHHSKATSHFWANIYESFKQMVPWRQRQEKQRKWNASKFDTV